MPFSLAGISRSVTLTAAYLSSSVGLSHQESLQCARCARNSVSPNIGFQRQLHEFEQGGGLERERRRLRDKFRVRPALSPRGRDRLLLAAAASAASPLVSSVPDADNLTLGDEARCADLLRRYRRLVLGGHICGGDCPDGGVSCPSGVCRAHLR